MSGLLEKAQWIWTDAPEKNAYVAFVKQFNLSDLSQLRIDLFADTYYKLYLNGRFVNAGPAPFRKPVVMLDSYDLSAYAQAGENTLCIICHFVGKTIKWNETDAPCLAAEIHSVDAYIATDNTWQSYPLSVWQADAPDMVWALGAVEAMDAHDPSYEVLRHFASEDYGVSQKALTFKPQKTKIVEPRISEIRARMVPYLKWERIICRAEPRISKTSRETFNLNDHAMRTNFEHKPHVWDADAVHMFQDDGVHLNRWVGERGFALHYDFRRICAGEFSFEIESDSEATVDIGFTEQMLNGIPEISRAGSKFYMRIKLRRGTNKFRMYKFTGFRHLYVTCKDFVGDLHIKPPVCHECHADLSYEADFFSKDRALNAIYDISRRSIILNTQAQSYDCNSREQGCYWGDSLFILDMVGHMTGDFSQMRHLCYAMRDEYAAKGEVYSSLFGLGTVLFDYCLVPMEVMSRYYRYTGDRQCIEDNLSCAEQIVDDFRQLKDPNGLIALRNWTKDDNETIRKGLLFLDHAGLGWHPRDSVGIDRDDYNAGINLFYLKALQSLDELHVALGLERPFKQEIEAHRELIYTSFYDASVALLIDAVDEGKTEKNFSQIVNALAISTGVLVAAEAETALALICALEQETWIAHGTPYGYFFVIDAMRACGRTDKILPLIKLLFTPMLERQATCTWETFGGEIHDSLNHAWSAALPYALQRLICGLDMDAAAYAPVVLRPALAAINDCACRFSLPQGLLGVEWKRLNAQQLQLRIAVADDMTVRLELDDAVHEIDADTTLILERPYS